MAIEYDYRADHYITLGVASAATLEDIKKAHRALIRELHPDCGGEPDLAANVNAARDVLMNPITRKEYDDAREDWHQQHPLLSIFSDAGEQLHRERQQTKTARPAEWFDDGPTAGRAATSQAWRPRPAESGQPLDPQASTPEQPAQARPQEWHVNIARTFVADDVSQAMLSGSWLKAFAILGAAYILDRVIENRVGDDPARREIVADVTKQLELIQASQHHQDVVAQLDRDRAKPRVRMASRRNAVVRSSRKAARSSRSKKVAGSKRRGTRSSRGQIRARRPRLG